jgi:protein TonB
MLLRAIAVLVSLLIHGVIGYAIWPRLHETQLDVLDLGKGMDIVVAPQGMVTSEVTNLGRDLESIEAHDVVPADRQAPAPLSRAIRPPEQARDVVGEVKGKETKDVAAVEEQKPAPPSPTAKAPEQLHDVVEGIESPKAPDLVAPEEPKLTPQSPTVTPAEPLRDVIASEKSAVEDEIVKTSEPPPAQVKEPKAAEAYEPSRVDQLNDAKVIRAGEPPDKPAEPQVAKADEAPAPDQLKEPKIVEVPEPPPENQPKEQKLVRADKAVPADQSEESKLTYADKTVPLDSIEDRKPEVTKMEVQPEQLAILTERSTSKAKTARDAQTAEIYLGKINERVQRSKVNPHSRETGIVILKFTIGTNGSLLSKGIALSSGSPELDAAALTTLISAAPFPPIPPEVSAKPMTFTQLFKFIIR